MNASEHNHSIVRLGVSADKASKARTWTITSSQLLPFGRLAGLISHNTGEEDTLTDAQPESKTSYVPMDEIFPHSHESKPHCSSDLSSSEQSLDLLTNSEGACSYLASEEEEDLWYIAVQAGEVLEVQKAAPRLANH